MGEYARVVPRDLFNEADLLKCLGRLAILCGEALAPPGAGFATDVVDRFEIEQDPADGSISVVNLPFRARGRAWRLWRPLNARSPWPLMASDAEDPDREIEVFDDEGGLSRDMEAMLSGRAPADA